MKAQIFSMDLFFAIVVVLIIISAVSFVILDFVDIHERELEMRDMQIRGQRAVDSLINSPGDWDGGGGG